MIHFGTPTVNPISFKLSASCSSFKLFVSITVGSCIGFACWFDLSVALMQMYHAETFVYFKLMLFMQHLKLLF